MEKFNLKEIIESNQAVMVYFGGQNCGVCKVLHPKIKDSFEKEFPNIKQVYIDIEEDKTTAIEYNIFAIPTIIIFFEGKEFIRKSRNLSVQAFIDEVSRPYGLFFN